ncbi:MAG: hypothetical protein GXO25_07515 [Euryarchaeota archaeon]|nr:hypothetical protein [Euryarchaeota archaeon]
MDLHFDDICLKVNLMFKEQSEQYRNKWEEERKKKVETAKKRYLEAEEAYEKVMSKYKKTDVEYQKVYKRYTQEFSKYIKAQREYDINEYAQTIKFARLKVEPHQIFFFGQMFLIFSILFLMVVDVIVLIVTHSIIATLVAVLITLLLPFIGYAFIVNYPYMKANSLRIRMLGFMPEAVSYMVMSLYLNPSLEHAVAFASENTEEPLASDLKRILWGVYLREYDTIEDSFVSFAYEWGRWNDGFKRALYTLRTSTMRSREDERKETLDKASKIMMDSSKRDLLEYADSLYIPTMILFTVGVMLPLILASLLPITPIGKSYTWVVVLLFDVAIPLMFFLYSRKIIEEKPTLTIPPDLKVPMTKNERNILIVVSLLVGAVFFFFALRSTDYVYSSLYLWALSVPLAIYLFFTSYPLKMERDTIVEMNDDFPDALFNLGSRIAEGEPFESAMEKVVALMRGSAVEILFRRILYSLKTSRDSLEEILFGNDGILKDKSTKVINTTMRVTVDAMRKDNVTAGNMIISIASHLRDMKGIEKEMKSRIGSATSMMQMTALYFGPITIAVTMVLYAVILGKLEAVATLIPNNSVFSIGFLKMQHISAYDFSIIMVVYVFLTVLITGYFYTNVMYGHDPIQNRYEMAKMLLIAPVLYTVSIYFLNGFFASFMG